MSSPFSPSALALEIDWSGQFWSEFNYIHNYAMDNSPNGASVDNTRAIAGGYYVPGSGSQDASFQSVFLRVRPKIIVNDNIYIKSEWWLGDPIYSIFGGGLPYGSDQRQYFSFQSRGSAISAQRVWGEFLTDIGTFQVGRVPLNWGLGLVWNNGDGLFSRYMSTGDAIRWIAKFGAFSFVPSVIVNSAGNTISGACTVTGGTCIPGAGQGGVVDYSIALKYENIEDEMEVGVNVIRRFGAANQDPNGGVLTPPQTNTTGSALGTVAVPNAGGINYTVFDFFVKKKFREFSIGAEAPLATGSAGTGYSAFAVGGEVDWRPSDIWDFHLKSGYAPGQPNSSSGTISTYNAFYFHPNYHIGTIMFNYQLANFAGGQTLNNPGMSASNLKSPYFNPIVNAAYFSLGTEIRPWDKWTFRPGVIYAYAPNAAAAGSFFFNYWTQQMVNNASGVDQGNSLGWEVDLGVTFQWDEHFQFNIDTGIFMPGSFYAFSNVPGTPNQQSAVFAASARVGVSF
ncbi:MAG: hypothetical protein HYX41_06495 [Bdellovibrio sp.]|nr:hypothetical protein [Bdellovibrio sp.]